MSIFSIGLSGLNAARIAFNTTSNNIANVNTPGYNRELPIFAQSGASQGVTVADVQRQFDGYIASQLNAANSKTSGLDAYQTQVSQIDNLLADEDSGLAPLMQKFFGSVATLAGSPADPAARQGVLGSADTLAAQFRSFDQYLADMATGVNGQLSNEVSQINNTARQIADLNTQITLAKAKLGQAPNSLLDQRDQLVADLAQHVNVTATAQDNGTYNISIGNGQPLVSGGRQFTLQVVTSAADPTSTVVGYDDAAGNVVELADSTFTGGTLGGLLMFRDETLNPTRSQLGQLAVSLAQGVNAVHANGIDLDGNAGQAMFGVGNPQAFANQRNTGTASAAVAFDPANGAQLTANDYDLKYDAASNTFTITNLGTGEASSQALGAGNALSVGGVTVTIDDPTQLQDGDRFRVLPTRTAAAGFENLIHDTSAIAAASAAGGSGNNENALALQDLQTQSTVGGKAAFNQAYAGMVSSVGSRTNIIKVNLAAQQSLSDQLMAVQQSQSGVNMDEEAMNLVMYQQYYQANAKVIQTGSTILDTILSLR
ncbi:MAG TPA: flagellar hook-associated protein FlgK [Rhodanobacteraceae bacterium]|nr:flagellar hook-associated protein FlgK [Rhodanobacteraceae bacterium]